jgi:CO/xanthine dehydrogenase Mo-binding subunit
MDLNTINDVVGPTLWHELGSYRNTNMPRSELYFAKTSDAFGPLGAKSMSESPINPIAPALANALAVATGIRFTKLPLRPHCIYQRIFKKTAGGKKS